MATFDMNRRGGMTVNRESLHASPEYKRQIEALDKLRTTPMTPNLLDELEGVVAKIRATTDPTAADDAATFIENHHAALADMAKRLEALQSLAAAMYQAAGAYDMPVRFLDVLAAAGNGEAITEEQVDALLPCETPDTLQRLEAAQRKLSRLTGMRNEWERDAREHLMTFGQHLPASVECLVERFDAAIDAAQEGEG